MSNFGEALLLAIADQLFLQYSRVVATASSSPITLFWFRRDLRLFDNAGLFHALTENPSVQPLFIFDTDILGALDDPRDARVDFIHQTLMEIKQQLREQGSDLWVFYGKPLRVWKDILGMYDVNAVYANRDEEPAARKRDEEIAKLLRSQGLELKTFKDHSLFEREEILNGSGQPYTIYTPYKNKVLQTMKASHLKSFPSERHFAHLRKVGAKGVSVLMSLKDIGFLPSAAEFSSAKVATRIIKNYDKTRDFPALENGTTHMGLHLRFGTVSIRQLAKTAEKLNAVWLSELIWRDFFKQILWNFPRVQNESFRPAYDKIAWRKSKSDFERWASGTTGYPWVDAGMRQLNETGFMHNRVRMAVASFLSKHLLLYWLEGERYFAKKLLDYDLSANNGNWQWAAGTGCDAAPYFRVFNPEAQAKKFDRDEIYIRRWISEFGTNKYPKPMVEHAYARGRALQYYGQGLKKDGGLS